MRSENKKGLAQNRYKNRPLDAGGRLRLSGVSYLNAHPILHGLLSGLAEDRMHLTLQPPAEIARQLFEDEIDAGLSPVATLAAHGGLEIVPGIAIGCDGPVWSVRLVSECPLAELEEVLLDASSRTSAVLARLCLRELRGGAEPRYCAKPVDEIFELVGGTRGGLLIGDPALETERSFRYELDLGHAWKQMTGLPFVFAVWVARPGVLSERDALLLAGSLEAGLRERDKIAAAGSKP
jgi:predicted solute-binding protein